MGSNNVNLPWADALEKACIWSLGAKTLGEAAERITRAVNQVPNVSYTPATMFCPGLYNLTGYLNALDNSTSFVMNCRDCANAVTTFSNLLESNLYEDKFSNLNTRPFLTLSDEASNPFDWVTWNWGWHEIAWTGPTLDEKGLVYDGCLQIDVDNDYTDTVHTVQHPVKIKFGAISDGTNYRYRLIQSGTGTPNPPANQRRVM